MIDISNLFAHYYTADIAALTFIFSGILKCAVVYSVQFLQRKSKEKEKTQNGFKYILF